MGRPPFAPRPELVLVGVTVLWGSTFIVTKDVVRTWSPLTFLSLRFGLAALVLGLIARHGLPRSRAALRDGALLGLLNAVGLLLQVFGQAYTTASKSAFVTSLNTPLTPIIALLLYGTRPTRAQRVAVVLATMGLFLLTWPGPQARFNPGDLLTLACAAFYALAIVEYARRSPRHEVWGLTLTQVATAALLFGTLLLIGRLVLRWVPPAALPELLRLEARPFVLEPKLLAELLYMALVCTVVTFAGQTWAMARLSATHSAVIFALEPVFATAMAIGWEGSAEWPGTGGAVGAALVLGAVVVSELRRR